ncbi:MAG TPA: RiPP maturation radical SAM C-methyltransferase [Chloroflexia bacterium]|nr:RiPP maturation radical SAM C-methyltransferase [Chloroflexia bacterium]
MTNNLNSLTASLVETFYMPASERHDFPVALVTMPFVSHHRPSIQLGLLRSIAWEHGFDVTTFHLNLDFARQIGPELYDKLCEYRGHLLGDWLFAGAAFGEALSGDNDAFLKLSGFELENAPAEMAIESRRLKEIRSEEVPVYLEVLLNTIDWGRFKLVGFTSTFQQNMASFALAAALKRRYPQIRTVFGGSNFEGEMGLELTRTIECVDYAVIGEGDKAFPELLLALAEGCDPAEVPGVVCRHQGRVTPLRSRPPLRSLDDLPAPDYTEYFERARHLDLLPQTSEERIYLPFESSRGCWWGQKQQCTFCGLNGNGIVYRAKSPRKVQSELDELAKFYPQVVMEAVDNILDMSYLNTFMRQLSETKPGYELFYEVKANLSRQQIKLLHEAGVIKVQPGIESLNSHILKLMRKGISASQNINTLRWARYYGLGVGWNLLWGFPGETIEDYQEQAALVPLLAHLFPPGGFGRIWMERFSPIYFEKENFPTRYIRPEASYAYLYPPEVDLNKIAYFFDYQFEQSLPDSVYEQTARALSAWQEAWKKPEKPHLFYRVYQGFLQIEDYRKPEEHRSYTIEEPQAAIYRAFSDRPHTALAVKTRLDLSCSLSEMEQILQKFCEYGLMMRDGNYYLSLALPARAARTLVKNGIVYFSLPQEEEQEAVTALD